MKRFTSERVVVTWGHPIAGTHHDRETTADYRKAAAELYRDLIEQFENIDLLQFSTGKCMLRTILMEGEDGCDTAVSICAALKERGIDYSTSRVVDLEQGTPLTDQLRQAAKVHGDTAFVDAADEIDKSRPLIKRLRQQLIDVTSAKADRYKHAATALWQALDSIAEIDAINGDDARFRLDARQLAKLRLEHAIRRGRELLWSWQSPLPLSPEHGIDLSVRIAEEAGAIDNQVTESNRQGGTGEARLRVWLHDAGLGGLMPECIGEAELSRLEVKVLVGKASDAEIAQYKQAKEAIDAQFKRSPEHQAAAAQWLIDNPFADSPEEKLERGGTLAYFERCDREVAASLDTKQCQNCRHVQMHPDGDRGRCARVWAAMPEVAHANTCEHWRLQFVNLSTEDGHVEHLGAGQPANKGPDGPGLERCAACGVSIPEGWGHDCSGSETRVTISLDCSTTADDVADALDAVDPANPDFAPALDLLADAEFPIDEADDA